MNEKNEYSSMSFFMVISQLILFSLFIISNIHKEEQELLLIQTGTLEVLSIICFYVLFKRGNFFRRIAKENSDDVRRQQMKEFLQSEERLFDAITSNGCWMVRDQVTAILPTVDWSLDENNANQNKLLSLYSLYKEREKELVDAIKNIPPIASLHSNIMKSEFMGTNYQTYIMCAIAVIFIDIHKAKKRINELDKEINKVLEGMIFPAAYTSS